MESENQQQTDINTTNITQLTDEEKRKLRLERFGGVSNETIHTGEEGRLKKAEKKDLRDRITKKSDKESQTKFKSMEISELEADALKIKQRQEKFGETDEGKRALEQIQKAIQFKEENKGNPDYELGELLEPIHSEQRRHFINIKQKMKEKWSKKNKKDKGKWWLKNSKEVNQDLDSNE